MKEIKLTKLKEKIYYDKCDNGLEIYMWVNEKTSNYYATLNVRYGSIDTDFKVKNSLYHVENGIAHFLEHVTFNIDENTSANEYFDKKGTSTNAFTTFEYTSYEAYGSNDIVGDVNYLLDFVQNKYLTDNLVEKEKGIIIEEVRMGKNDPSRVMYFQINKSLYENNNRKNLITGEEEEVEKISKKSLDLVFDSFYHPSNMFIVITGNFNPYELSTSIKENQSKKKFKNTSVKKVYAKEEDKVVDSIKEIKGNVEIPKISISYKMSRKKFNDINDVELKMYLNIIMNANFGPTSNFKEDLMEKELIYSLFTSNYVNKDIVVLNVIAETKYPNELTNIIKDAFDNLSVSEERLKRRIKCEIANIISGLDDIEFVNTFIQENLIIHSKLIYNIYDIYKSLTIDEAKRVIKHIDLNNQSVVIMNTKK